MAASPYKEADDGCKSETKHEAGAHLMRASIFLILALFGGDAPLDLPGGVRVERWFVPSDRQARFLPAGEIVHQRTLKEFDNLVARRRDLERRAPQRPTQCDMVAHFDPQTGELSGIATFQTPPGSAISLLPWSPSTRNAKFWDRADKLLPTATWGRSDSGAFIALSAEGTFVSRLQADWMQPGRRTAWGWRFEFSAPRAPIGTLTVQVPANWSVRSDLQRAPGAAAHQVKPRETAPPATPPPTPKQPSKAEASIPFELGGVESFSLDFAADDPSRALSQPFVQSRRTFIVDPLRWQMQAEIQFEANREPIEQIALVFESSAQPRDIQSSAPIDWRFETFPISQPEQPPRIRWIGKLRRPVVGGLRLAFSVDLGLPQAAGLRMPILYAEEALNRGDTATFALHPGVGLVDVFPGDFESTPVPARDDGRFSLALVGLADRVVGPSRMPTLRLKSADAVVEATQEETLDFTERPPKLTARVQWRCLEGRLFRPRVAIPKHWDVERVDVKNNERQIGSRIESESRGNFLLLELDRPLEVGQTLLATIRLEQLAGDFAPLKPGRFSLPLVRATQSRAGNAIAFACYLNDGWSIRANNVQSARELLLPYLNRMPPTLVPGLSFTVPPTQTGATLEVRPMAVKYDVEGRERIDLRSGQTVIELRSEVRPIRGLVEELHVASTMPLPMDIRWEVDPPPTGDASGIDSVQSRQVAGRTEYTVRLAAAATKPTMVIARWRSPTNSVPLISFPQANSWSNACEASAQPGQLVDVAVKDLPVRIPDVQPGRDVVWATRYERLPDSASLSILPRSPPAKALELQQLQQKIPARATVHSTIGRSHVTHEMDLEFRLDRPLQLTVGVPAGSIAAAQLDDRSFEYTSVNAAVQSINSLSAGSHRIKIAFTEPLERRFGLPLMKATVPFEQLRPTETRWTVRHGGRAWPLGVRGGGVESIPDSVLELADARERSSEAAEPWRYVCVQPDDSASLELWILPWASVQPWAWAFGALSFVLAMRSNTSGPRGVLVLIATWCFAAWLGDPLARIASFVLLPCLAGFALRQALHESRRRSFAMAVFALSASGFDLTPAIGQEAAPRTNYRVVVPFDPTKPDRMPDRVLVPDRLLEFLEQPLREADRPRLLTRSVVCVGKVLGNSIRWNLRYRGILAAGQFPADFSLNFERAFVGDGSVDGKPALARPQGDNGSVWLRAQKGGAVDIDLRVESPIERGDVWTVADFAIPRADTVDVQLDPGSGPVVLDHAGSTPGLGLDGAGRRIVGSLGPIRRLRIGWRPDAANVVPAQPTVRSLQLLDVSKATVEWTGVFSVAPVGGALRRLTFVVPPSLILRRIDGAGVLWWKVADARTATPPNRQVSVTVEFATPTVEPVQLKMQGFYFGSSAIQASFDFPCVLPEDGLVDSSWIGVRCGADRDVREIAGQDIEAVSAADFDREWERATGGPLERLASARQLRRPSAVAKYQIVRPTGGLTASQTIDILVDADSGQADTFLAATLIPKSGVELFVAEMKAPPHFRVQRVESDSVRRWYMSGDRLVCLRDAATAAEWTIRLHGRFAKVADAPIPGKALWKLGAFEWKDASSVSAAWNVKAVRATRLEVAEPMGLGSSRFEGGQWTIGSTAREHSFSLVAAVEAAVAAAGRGRSENERVEDGGLTNAPRLQSVVSRRQRIDPAVDVRLTQTGPSALAVRCLWRIETSGPCRVELSTPRSLQLDAVYLDGRPLPVSPSDDRKLQFQIPIRSGQQEFAALLTARLVGSTRASINLPTLKLSGSGEAAEPTAESQFRVLVGASSEGDWRIANSIANVDKVTLDRWRQVEAYSSGGSKLERAAALAAEPIFAELRAGQPVILRRTINWTRFAPSIPSWLAMVLTAFAFYAAGRPRSQQLRGVALVLAVALVGVCFCYDVGNLGFLAFGLVSLFWSGWGLRSADSSRLASSQNINADADATVAGLTIMSRPDTV